MRKLRQRFLLLTIAVIMVLTSMPAVAFAAEPDAEVPEVIASYEGDEIVDDYYDLPEYEDEYDEYYEYDEYDEYYEYDEYCDYDNYCEKHETDIAGAGYVPVTPFGAPVLVTTWEQLLDAVQTAPTDGTVRTIHVGDWLWAHSTLLPEWKLIVNPNQNIVITSEPGGPVQPIWSVFMPGYPPSPRANTFYIHGGTLTLSDIAVQGGIEIGVPNSDIGGRLYMHDGVLATQPTFGNVVTVNNGGTFTMLGGEINSETRLRSGVRVNEGATFNMHGGYIDNNGLPALVVFDGGGVYVAGAFNLYNGTIRNNRATRGGGVNVAPTGIFTMRGGEIGGNTATDHIGGGVNVDEGGTFNMYGGHINGNRAEGLQGPHNRPLGWGGGVYVAGTFNLFNGTIHSNSTRSSGGGVYVAPNGLFTMRGGEIRNNLSSSGSGGGVNVSPTGSFILYDGKIRSNIAGGGGGVSADAINHKHGSVVGEQAVFRMYGGAITDNIVSSHGGGVSIRESDFVMRGGVIDSNSATIGGGGIAFGGGVFTMYDGAITNNRVDSWFARGGGINFFGGGGLAGTAGSDRFIMHNGSISNNSARNGGGIFIDTSLFGIFGAMATAEIIIHNGNITNNTAIMNGGGIVLHMECCFNALYIAPAVVFYGNTANPLRINDAMAATHAARVRPGTVSAWAHPNGRPNNHVFNNLDISVWNENILPAALYTVTFDLNGGIASGADLAPEMTYGKAVGAANVPAPTHANYYFAGWRYNGQAEGSANLTSAQVAAWMVSGARTFIAQWSTTQTRQIIFHFYDGTGDYRAVPFVNGVLCPIEMQYVNNRATDVPQRYEFWGWFTNQHLDDSGRYHIRDIQGIPTTFRRPTLFEEIPQCLALNFTLTNAQFDALATDGTLHLYAVWFLWGDVNDDGVVNASDLDILLTHVLFRPIPNLRAADIVRDGVVNSSDLDLLFRYVVFGNVVLPQIP